MNTVTESNRIRKFKRYKAQTNFQLTLKNETFNCKLLDYSDGLKAVVYASPLLTPGTGLDINISQPEISLKGEVAWSKKFYSELLVGVRRKSMIQGAFKDFKLSDILLGLQSSSRTGILVVKSNSVIKRVYFQNGEIVFATSNEEEDHLSEVLFKKGKISYKQYSNTMSIFKKGKKKQGTILVEQGFLNPRELIEAVKHQVEEIIVSLFTFKDGEFKFTEGLSSGYGPLILDINFAHILYRGIKRINRFESIKKFCPPIDTHIYQSPYNPEIAKDIPLDDIDMRLFSSINNKISLKNLLSLSPFNDFETLKSLYTLMGIGLVRVCEEDQEVTAEDLISEFYTENSSDFNSELEDFSRRCESHDYYKILDIDSSASPLDIKKAYYKMALKFHPDRQGGYLPEDVRSKLTKLFSFLTEAYTIISDPEQRKEYNQGLSRNNVTTEDDSYSSQAQALFNNGLLEMWSHDLTKAANLFHRATQLDCSQGKYFYYYSHTLRNQKRFKEGLEAINKAVKIEPDNPDYMAELGYICMGLDLMIRAKNNFERALKISPSHKKARAGLNEMEEYQILKKNASKSKILSHLMSSTFVLFCK